MTPIRSVDGLPVGDGKRGALTKTLQEEFLPAYRHCPDIEEFNSGLVAWMTEYNHERPHEALGYKTPYEVACSSPNPLPRIDENDRSYVYGTD